MKVTTELTIKCKKSLYKYTYKKNAFTKGKFYTFCDRDFHHGADIIWMIDSQNQEFSFSLEPDGFLRLFSDYFYGPAPTVEKW